MTPRHPRPAPTLPAPGARITTRRLLAPLLLAARGPARAADDDDALDALRRTGAVGLMRHAWAPGTGDPPGFRLGDCATQRNLDAAGREQARGIGARLRAAGIAARVFSGQWCRALETAELLGLGPVEPLPSLDSFFGGRADEPVRTAATRRFMADWTGGPLILVTHQVNVMALSGVYPGDGEMVVLHPGAGGHVVAARLPPPGR